MQVTEAERHHLYESLKIHLGSESADTLMNLIPPIDWSELATKSDFRRIDERIDAMSETMATAMATKTDLAEMRADLMRTFGTWLFASQAAVIACVTVVVAFLG